MGATLVNKVVQRWSNHLSDRAFRVLVAMAVTAKDNASKDVPAAVYFGGHDALTTALARKDGTSDSSAIRTVRRAIQELEEVGAIRLTAPAQLGSRACYLLTLNSEPQLRKTPVSESTHFKNREDTECPTGPDTECPTGEDTGCPHQEDTECPTCKEPLKEPLEELQEEDGVALRSDAAVVAPGADAKKPEIPPPKCPEPTCAKGFILVGDPPMLALCPRCNSNVIPFPERKSA